jgi:prolipoprotein diacylglyceryltransferase
VARSTPCPLHPQPSGQRVNIGRAFIHFYGLMYVIGITAAIVITQRRWKARGRFINPAGDIIATWR